VIRIELPWPDSGLSPNARGHWSKKAKAVKAARGLAGWTAVQIQQLEQLKGADRLDVVITYTPPNRKARDTDNMVASSKAYFDGIVDVIGVDDSKWDITIRREPPREPGEVRLEFEVGNG